MLGKHCVAAALIAATVSIPVASAHYSGKVLHAFCSQTGCADGVGPVASLIRDQAGNIYGTAVGGGAHAAGVVFELMQSVSNPGHFKYKVVYDFCVQTACADGSTPYAPLIVDVAGNLYGTTQSGGAGGGIAFELHPNSDHTKWKLKVLYAFCSLSNCADGTGPVAGLTYAGAAAGQPYDGSSPLYGTTPAGGVSSYDLGPQGTAFSLTLVSGQWLESVIYNFCSVINTNTCLDGAQPNAPLIEDSSGNLFGTTFTGGQTGSGDNFYSDGTVFELSPSGSSWTESVLYNFCAEGNGLCYDGSSPLAGLALNGSGTLYGFTPSGGATCTHHSGCDGVVFQLSSGSYSVLYSFCPKKSCAGGGDPLDGPTLDSQGNIFGSTNYGGDSTNVSGGAGTVVEFAGGVPATLYRFCAQPGCPDGAYPVGGIILDGSGNYFGTTQYGGATNDGVVYELMP